VRKLSKSADGDLSAAKARGKRRSGRNKCWGINAVVERSTLHEERARGKKSAKRVTQHGPAFLSNFYRVPGSLPPGADRGRGETKKGGRGRKVDEKGLRIGRFGRTFLRITRGRKASEMSV